MLLPPPKENIDKKLTNSVREKKDDSKKSKMTAIDDCEVTRMSTASGTDCWGNPFNIKAACTVNAGNCESANSQAAACAFSKAQLAAMLIYDECS